jgi:hypothetical protein
MDRANKLRKTKRYVENTEHEKTFLAMMETKKEMEKNYYEFP